MRTLRIFAVGTAAFVAFLLITLWVKWALLVIAALPIALIGIGQLLLPEPRRSFRVWMNPELLEHIEGMTLRLSGKDVDLGFFKRWYEFEIQVYNLWLLLMMALASLVALAWAWSLQDMPMPGGLSYYAGSVWLLVIYLAWRWLWERRAMRNSGFALGSFRIAHEAGPHMIRVVYQFVADDGQYHGGSFKTFSCDTADDLTIIFFDAANPEVSVPASAMMFHRLKWSAASREPHQFQVTKP